MNICERLLLAGQLTLINSGVVSSTSGLRDLRKNLEMQGISERASKLITGARRQGRVSNYESALRKWSHWCGKEKVDSVKCSMNYVLYFLAYLFGMGFEYSTIVFLGFAKVKKTRDFLMFSGTVVVVNCFHKKLHHR